MKYSTTAFAIAACLVSLTLLSEEQPEQPGKNIQAVDRESAPPVPRPSLQEARRQAGSLHTAIHATLQAVHRGQQPVIKPFAPTQPPAARVKGYARHQHQVQPV